VSDTDFRAGLTPNEAANQLLQWLERADGYSGKRKRQFQRSASAIKWLSLGLSGASTIILGVQDLDFWSGMGFTLVALTTVLNAVEPYFNWRSRWVLMEEARYRFYVLQDDLRYLLLKTSDADLRFGDIDVMYDRYRQIWMSLSEQWIGHRRSVEVRS
jgi:hypothetical protein